MKNALFIALCACFWAGQAFGQTQPATADTLWFEGKYYSPEGYKAAKAEHEKRNFDTYFMPGLAYTYYQPQASDSIGQFRGVSVEYLLLAHVAQNDTYGPSHVRLYAKLNILNSSREQFQPIFMYGLGVDLSLERNPNRTFLIPYFGLEMGGMSQRQWGGSFQFTPTLGIHFLSKKTLFVNAHGGYVYPVRNFDLLRGWFVQGGFNFALW